MLHCVHPNFLSLLSIECTQFRTVKTKRNLCTSLPQSVCLQYLNYLELSEFLYDKHRENVFPKRFRAFRVKESNSYSSFIVFYSLPLSVRVHRLNGLYTYERNIYIQMRNENVCPTSSPKNFLEH